MNSKYMSTMALKMSITTTLLMIITNKKEKTLMVEWSMMNYLSTNFKMSMMMDTKSLAFASCVMLITSSVILYSKYYMSSSKKKNSFMKLIAAFILSMMMLIFSQNMISTVMGWEGLGMTSFILIMFYQNKKSLNSSFYTMMMNRVGDVALMMAMIKLMDSSSWTFNSTALNYETAMVGMMVTAAFSKSAQMPFSSWLTEAMAAPTPISALVHSSTLVTAGIFLFIRFEQTLKYSKISTTIFLVSLTTLVMASMNSTTEWDLKKVVALSTLSQLSMMFITISMNLFNLAMFHLLVHATLKALIFLCSSSLISFMNTQDIRKMSKLTKKMFITKMSMNMASLTLCGFPFMSSFFSKEMIMEMMMMKKMNTMMIIMFYLCMMCTLLYSFKIMMTVNQKKASQTQTPLKEQLSQKMSKLMLTVPSIIYGNKMNWIINMNFKVPHLTSKEKLIPTAMMMIMMMVIKTMDKSEKNSSMKTKTNATMWNYMWFTKNMSIQVKKITLTSFNTAFKNTEKTAFHEMIKTMKNNMSKSSTSNFTKIHTKTFKTTLMMMTATMMMI